MISSPVAESSGQTLGADDVLLAELREAFGVGTHGVRRRKRVRLGASLRGNSASSCADDAKSPVVGSYEAYGPVHDGYPMPTAKAEHYEHYVWPAEFDVSELVLPVLVKQNRFGDWIVALYFKADASLLDPDEPVSGCSFG